MELLEKTLKQISPVTLSLASSIQNRLDNLTKPQGSLGKLEEIALRYCIARGTISPVIKEKHIFCFAADHGVTAEKVSAYPPSVTPQMVRNILGGGAAISVLTRYENIKLTVVDIGVADPLDGLTGLCRKKIAYGTANIINGPAMKKAEAIKAIEIGIEIALEAETNGTTLLGTGEMGIGNTTPATALYCAYLNLPPDELTGYGTGITPEKLKHKIDVIRTALHINKNFLEDPLSILTALGGFEIAGICGLILGGASKKVPIVVDGFISSAAALAACKINPYVKDYLFFSHLSAERGHKIFLEQFNTFPILSLDMRLGEGTGAALAMNIIEAAIKIYNEMATFQSAGVAEKNQ